MTLSNLPWYYFLLFVIGGYFVLWILDKFRIIKSKPLRYFIGIAIYSLAFWIIYDLFLASN